VGGITKASYYFWNGDIDSLEKLLESNPDSPIILQYIELYNSRVLLADTLPR